MPWRSRRDTLYHSSDVVLCRAALLSSLPCRLPASPPPPPPPPAGPTACRCQSCCSCCASCSAAAPASSAMLPPGVSGTAAMPSASPIRSKCSARARASHTSPHTSAAPGGCPAARGVCQGGVQGLGQHRAAGQLAARHPRSALPNAACSSEEQPAPAPALDSTPAAAWGAAAAAAAACSPLAAGLAGPPDSGASASGRNRSSSSVQSSMAASAAAASLWCSRSASRSGGRNIVAARGHEDGRPKGGCASSHAQATRPGPGGSSRRDASLTVTAHPAHPQPHAAPLPVAPHLSLACAPPAGVLMWRLRADARLAVYSWNRSPTARRTAAPTRGECRRRHSPAVASSSSSR